MTDPRKPAPVARPASGRMKALKLLLKLAFIALIFVFLGKKGFISLDATRNAFGQVDRMAMAFGALITTSLLSVIRWQWLLRAQDIRLAWTRTLQLTFIGMFFNIALPGAVSGDFVKAFYIAREVHGKRARAFGSILFDRVAGLSALVLVSAFSFSLGYESFSKTPLFQGVLTFVCTAAACVVAFYTYLLLVRERHDPLLLFFKKAEKRFKWAGSFTRIYEGIREYHNRRWTVCKAIGISVAIHLLVCFAVLQFSLALGDDFISPLSVFVVVPLGLLFTAIPLLPAGVGTGHAAFTWLFLLLASQRGADIFNLFLLVQILFGAVGGLVYLRFRSHEPKPSMDGTAFA